MYLRLISGGWYCLLSVILAVTTAVAADADEQAIQKTYIAWVKAANDKDIAKWSFFLADNPYFLPPDAALLTSKQAVIDYYEIAFSDSRFSLDCEQQKVEISESGEMAWALGICKATFTGADNEAASGTSRWFKVWIKQADGSWKGRVNSWKFEDTP
jgi:ketosteroid isomerase-like protein